jgi:hypothetical protein
LTRRAGLKTDFPREYDNWRQRPAMFVPSPLTSTESNLVHVHTDFWNKAREYVEQGGFLYASLSADAAIPGMEQIFGARLEDHAPAGEVTSGSRQWAVTLAVRGGRVIAVDGAGRPALVAHSAGSGKTLLCSYPIESYLAGQPSLSTTTKPRIASTAPSAVGQDCNRYSRPIRPRLRFRA